MLPSDLLPETVQWVSLHLESLQYLYHMFSQSDIFHSPIFHFQRWHFHSCCFVTTSNIISDLPVSGFASIGQESLCNIYFQSGLCGFPLLYLWGYFKDYPVNNFVPLDQEHCLTYIFPLNSEYQQIFLEFQLLVVFTQHCLLIFELRHTTVIGCTLIISVASFAYLAHSFGRTA